MNVFAAFTLEQIAAAVIATFIAAIIRGLAGFGLAIMLVPILALALSPIEAVLTTNVIALAMGIGELKDHLRNAEKSALAISLMVLVTTAPGLWLLGQTPVPLARLIIAVLAILAFFIVLLPVRDAETPSTPITLGVGALSGLCTGFAGMPGLPVAPYYIGRDIPRQTAKASMLLVFTISAFAGLVAGAARGVLEWRLGVFGLMLFPIVLIGNYLGSLVFGKISDKVWRSFVALLLGATAIAALLKLLQS